MKEALFTDLLKQPAGEKPGYDIKGRFTYPAELRQTALVRLKRIKT